MKGCLIRKNIPQALTEYAREHCLLHKGVGGEKSSWRLHDPRDATSSVLKSDEAPVSSDRVYE
jgi:hypothetical protein